MATDRELVERCLAGEAEAFHGIVARYQAPLYRIAYRYLGDHHDATDLCQEAFGRAYEKLGQFDVERTFSSWLFAVAANLAKDLLRRRRRRPVVLGEPLANRPDGAVGPADRAAEREEAQRLRRAVDRLDDDKRLAVVLRYFEGKSVKEIAEITGDGVSTVKVRLFRARKDLFERL